MSKQVVDLICPLSYGKDEETKISQDLLNLDSGVYTTAKWLFHKKNVNKIKIGYFYSATPVTAQIVPTLLCNFRCPRCSYGKAKIEEMLSHGKLTMDHNDMLLIIDRLCEGGVKGCIFTGGGETTYCPRLLLSGMRYAVQKNLDVGLFTNGSLLDSEIISELIDIGPRFIRISLDAVTPRLHRLLHGYSPTKDYASKVLNNLTILAKEKVRRKSKITIGVGVTVEPVNISDLGNIANVVKSIQLMEPKGGIDYVVFRPIVNYVKGKFCDRAKPVLDYLRAEMRESCQRYYDFLYKGAQFPSSFFAPVQSKVNNEVKPILEGTGVRVINLGTKFEGINNKKHPFKKCLASPWYIFVGPDGTVYHCVELGLDRRVAIGNLVNNTLEEIWQSKRRKKVIKFIDSKGLETLCPPVCVLYEMNTLFWRMHSLSAQAGDRKSEVKLQISHQIDALREEVVKHVDAKDANFIS